MKNLLLLHLVVLIFGCTGILGKLITIPSDQLVWYRMFFATCSLAVYILLMKKSFKMQRKGVLQTIGVGFIIAAHWISFFEAIKQSNVSIALAATATGSLFTALLEPIFFKRKLHLYELLLGSIVILGLYFIFQFETDNSIGIWLGVLAAFLASIFTVINGQLIKKYDSTRISLYELGGGVIAISIYFLIFSPSSLPNFQLSTSDWIWMLTLAILCTAFAFVASVKVMEELTPFTVSLSINLEPVYGILLALLIFGESEKMSSGFYIGTSLVLCSLFLNVWIKKRLRKKGYLINFSSLKENRK
ncbi:DMT family transporter [Vicingaceae bacterium]|nr:DMT family transporter [Vicingaceae bacterium]MDC1452032.1 DMT family transporter [Vicingaceae bacterium]